MTVELQRKMVREMTTTVMLLMMTMATLMMTLTCILLLVRTMRMTVELPSTAVSEIAQ